MKTVMKTEIISSENVKPSSPTPRNLQKYNLSMLDQTLAPILVPIVLYYPCTSNTNDPSFETLIHQLKHSLSVILTRFYPLAGRISGKDASIDCSDQGIPFTVAEVNGLKLSDLLKNLGPKSACQLLPSEVTLDIAEAGRPGSAVATIQVTRFDCGGFAVGAALSHRIADASTISHFLKCWAHAARGSNEAACPNFIAQSLFPQIKEMPDPDEAYRAIFMKRGKSIMRRYVFGAEAISILRSKLQSSNIDNLDRRPISRVEAVSALLWKCFMAASLANGRSESVVVYAVNLRRRARPPFPSDCFGNLVTSFTTSSTNENNNIGELAGKIRDKVSQIDGDYINRMLGDEGFQGWMENYGRTNSEMINFQEARDALCISSWCGFGLYEVDFGLGKPVWVHKYDAGDDDPESAFVNIVCLMDSRDGDGIEAVVTLGEKYMEIFDNVEELRGLASRDPSPLDS